MKLCLAILFTLITVSHGSSNPETDDNDCHVLIGNEVSFRVEEAFDWKYEFTSLVSKRNSGSRYHLSDKGDKCYGSITTEECEKDISEERRVTITPVEDHKVLTEKECAYFAREYANKCCIDIHVISFIPPTNYWEERCAPNEAPFYQRYGWTTNRGCFFKEYQVEDAVGTGRTTNAISNDDKFIDSTAEFYADWVWWTTLSRIYFAVPLKTFTTPRDFPIYEDQTVEYYAENGKKLYRRRPDEKIKHPNYGYGAIMWNETTGIPVADKCLYRNGEPEPRTCMCGGEQIERLTYGCVSEEKVPINCSLVVGMGVDCMFINDAGNEVWCDGYYTKRGCVFQCDVDQDDPFPIPEQLGCMCNGVHCSTGRHCNRDATEHTQGVPTKENFDCTSHDDCLASEYCDTDAKCKKGCHEFEISTTENTACTVDSDCSKNEFCMDGTCRKGCGGLTSSMVGVLDGEYGSQCFSHLDCTGPNEDCIDDACVEFDTNTEGLPCSSHDDCNHVLGRCVNDVCRKYCQPWGNNVCRHPRFTQCKFNPDDDDNGYCFDGCTTTLEMNIGVAANYTECDAYYQEHKHTFTKCENYFGFYCPEQLPTTSYFRDIPVSNDYALPDPSVASWALDRPNGCLIIRNEDQSIYEMVYNNISETGTCGMSHSTPTPYFKHGECVDGTCDEIKCAQPSGADSSCGTCGNVWTAEDCLNSYNAVFNGIPCCSLNTPSCTEDSECLLPPYLPPQTVDCLSLETTCPKVKGNLRLQASVDAQCHNPLFNKCDMINLLCEPGLNSNHTHGDQTLVDEECLHPEYSKCDMERRTCVTGFCEFNSYYGSDDWRLQLQWHSFDNEANCLKQPGTVYNSALSSYRCDISPTIEDTCNNIGDDEDACKAAGNGACSWITAKEGKIEYYFNKTYEPTMCASSECEVNAAVEHQCLCAGEELSPDKEETNGKGRDPGKFNQISCFDGFSSEYPPCVEGAMVSSGAGYQKWMEYYYYTFQGNTRRGDRWVHEYDGCQCIKNKDDLLATTDDLTWTENFLNPIVYDTKVTTDEQSAIRYPTALCPHPNICLDGLCLPECGENGVNDGIECFCGQSLTYKAPEKYCYKKSSLVLDYAPCEYNKEASSSCQCFSYDDYDPDYNAGVLVYPGSCLRNYRWYGLYTGTQIHSVGDQPFLLYMCEHDDITTKNPEYCVCARYFSRYFSRYVNPEDTYCYNYRAKYDCVIGEVHDKQCVCSGSLCEKDQSCQSDGSCLTACPEGISSSECYCNDGVCSANQLCSDEGCVDGCLNTDGTLNDDPCACGTSVTDDDNPYCYDETVSPFPQCDLWSLDYTGSCICSNHTASDVTKCDRSAGDICGTRYERDIPEIGCSGFSNDLYVLSESSDHDLMTSEECEYYGLFSGYAWGNTINDASKPSGCHLLDTSIYTYLQETTLYYNEHINENAFGNGIQAIYHADVPPVIDTCFVTDGSIPVKRRCTCGTQTAERLQHCYTDIISDYGACDTDVILSEACFCSEGDCISGEMCKNGQCTPICEQNIEIFSPCVCDDVVLSSGYCHGTYNSVNPKCVPDTISWGNCYDESLGFTTKEGCLNQGIWEPGCSNGAYDSEESCETQGTWHVTERHCSNSDIFANSKTECETPGVFNEYCTDSRYSEEDCYHEPGVWTSNTCKHSQYRGQENCETQGVWTPADPNERVCHNKHIYIDETSCLTPGFWSDGPCSIDGFQNKNSCETEGIWQGCSNPAIQTEGACLEVGTWHEGSGYCERWIKNTVWEFLVDETFTTQNDCANRGIWKPGECRYGFGGDIVMECRMTPFWYAFDKKFTDEDACTKQGVYANGVCTTWNGEVLGGGRDIDEDHCSAPAGTWKRKYEYPDVSCDYYFDNTPVCLDADDGTPLTGERSTDQETCESSIGIWTWTQCQSAGTSLLSGREQSKELCEAVTTYDVCKDKYGNQLFGGREVIKKTCELPAGVWGSCSRCDGCTISEFYSHLVLDSQESCETRGVWTYPLCVTATTTYIDKDVDTCHLLTGQFTVSSCTASGAPLTGGRDIDKEHCEAPVGVWGKQSCTTGHTICSDPYCHSPDWDVSNTGTFPTDEYTCTNKGTWTAYDWADIIGDQTCEQAHFTNQISCEINGKWLGTCVSDIADEESCHLRDETIPYVQFPVQFKTATTGTYSNTPSTTSWSHVQTEEQCRMYFNRYTGSEEHKWAKNAYVIGKFNTGDIHVGCISDTWRNGVQWNDFDRAPSTDFLPTCTGKYPCVLMKVQEDDDEYYDLTPEWNDQCKVHKSQPLGGIVCTSTTNTESGCNQVGGSWWRDKDLCYFASIGTKAECKEKNTGVMVGEWIDAPTGRQDANLCTLQQGTWNNNRCELQEYSASYQEEDDWVGARTKCLDSSISNGYNSHFEEDCYRVTEEGRNDGKYTFKGTLSSSQRRSSTEYCHMPELSWDSEDSKCFYKPDQIDTKNACVATTTAVWDDKEGGTYNPRKYPYSFNIRSCYLEIIRFGRCLKDGVDITFTGEQLYHQHDCEYNGGEYIPTEWGGQDFAASATPDMTKPNGCYIENNKGYFNPTHQSETSCSTDLLCIKKHPKAVCVSEYGTWMDGLRMKDQSTCEGPVGQWMPESCRTYAGNINREDLSGGRELTPETCEASPGEWIDDACTHSLFPNPDLCDIQGKFKTACRADITEQHDCNQWGSWAEGCVLPYDSKATCELKSHDTCGSATEYDVTMHYFPYSNRCHMRIQGGDTTRCQFGGTSLNWYDESVSSRFTHSVDGDGYSNPTLCSSIVGVWDELNSACNYPKANGNKQDCESVGGRIGQCWYTDDNQDKRTLYNGRDIDKAHCEAPANWVANEQNEDPYCHYHFIQTENACNTPGVWENDRCNIGEGRSGHMADLGTQGMCEAPAGTWTTKCIDKKCDDPNNVNHFCTAPYLPNEEDCKIGVWEDRCTVSDFDAQACNGGAGDPGQWEEYYHVKANNRVHCEHQGGTYEQRMANPYYVCKVSGKGTLKKECTYIPTSYNSNRIRDAHQNIRKLSKEHCEANVRLNYDDTCLLIGDYATNKETCQNSVMDTHWGRCVVDSDPNVYGSGTALDKYHIRSSDRNMCELMTEWKGRGCSVKHYTKTGCENNNPSNVWEEICSSTEDGLIARDQRCVGYRFPTKEVCETQGIWYQAHVSGSTMRGGCAHPDTPTTWESAPGIRSNWYNQAICEAPAGVWNEHRGKCFIYDHECDTLTSQAYRIETMPDRKETCEFHGEWGQSRCLSNLINLKGHRDYSKAACEDKAYVYGVCNLPKTGGVTTASYKDDRGRSASKEACEAKSPTRWIKQCTVGGKVLYNERAVNKETCESVGTWYEFSEECKYSDASNQIITLQDGRDVSIEACEAPVGQFAYCSVGGERDTVQNCEKRTSTWGTCSCSENTECTEGQVCSNNVCVDPDACEVYNTELDTYCECNGIATPSQYCHGYISNYASCTENQKLDSPCNCGDGIDCTVDQTCISGVCYEPCPVDSRIEIGCICGANNLIANEGQFCYDTYVSDYKICELSVQSDDDCECGTDRTFVPKFEYCYETFTSPFPSCTDSGEKCHCGTQSNICPTGYNCVAGTCNLPDPCDRAIPVDHLWVRDFDNIERSDRYCLCNDKIIPPGEYCYEGYSSKYLTCSVYRNDVREYDSCRETYITTEECNAQNKKIEIDYHDYERWWMNFIDEHWRKERCSDTCLETETAIGETCFPNEGTQGSFYECTNVAIESSWGFGYETTNTKSSNHGVVVDSQTVVIAFDGQTYDLCSEDSASVTWEYNHDIQETTYTGYQNGDASEYIGSLLHDYVGAGVRTVDGLQAKYGATRYFVSVGIGGLVTQFEQGFKFATTCTRNNDLNCGAISLGDCSNASPPPAFDITGCDHKRFSENVYVNDFNFINPSDFAMSAGGAKPYGFRLKLQNLAEDDDIINKLGGSTDITRDGVTIDKQNEKDALDRKGYTDFIFEKPLVIGWSNTRLTGSIVDNPSQLEPMPFNRDFTLNEIWEKDVTNSTAIIPGNSYVKDAFALQGQLEKLEETPTGISAASFDQQSGKLEGCIVDNLGVSVRRIAYKASNKALLVDLQGTLKAGESILLKCYFPDRLQALPVTGTYQMNYNYGLEIMDDFDLHYDYTVDLGWSSLRYHNTDKITNTKLDFAPVTCQKLHSSYTLYGYSLTSENDWSSNSLDISVKCATSMGFHGKDTWDGSGDNIQVYSCAGELNEKVIEPFDWTMFQWFDESSSINPLLGVVPIGCEMGRAIPPAEIPRGYKIDDSDCNVFTSEKSECCGCTKYTPNNMFEFRPTFQQSFSQPNFLKRGYCPPKDRFDAEKIMRSGKSPVGNDTFCRSRHSVSPFRIKYFKDPTGFESLSGCYEFPNDGGVFYSTGANRECNLDDFLCVEKQDGRFQHGNGLLTEQECYTYARIRNNTEYLQLSDSTLLGGCQKYSNVILYNDVVNDYECSEVANCVIPETKHSTAVSNIHECDKFCAYDYFAYTNGTCVCTLTKDKSACPDWNMDLDTYQSSKIKNSYFNFQDQSCSLNSVNFCADNWHVDAEDVQCPDDKIWFTDNNFAWSRNQPTFTLPWNQQSSMKHVYLDFTEDTFQPNNPVSWGEYTFQGCVPPQIWELKPGWNWVSVGVHLRDPSLSSLQGFETGDRIICQGKRGEATYYESHGWVGTLQTLKTYEMCKVHVEVAKNIEIYGPVPSSPQITFKKGWNWIGFPTNETTLKNDIPVQELDLGFNAGSDRLKCQNSNELAINSGHTWYDGDNPSDLTIERNRGCHIYKENEETNSVGGMADFGKTWI